MTIKIELPVTGNWLNWDLYSEKALSKEEQIASLNQIRENIKNQIVSEGNKDHIFLTEIYLYSDSNNDRLFKLVVNSNNISYTNQVLIDEAIKHRHDYFITGEEKALAVGGVKPVPPKGKDHLYNTPFSRVLHEMRDAHVTRAILFT